jgi:hypothetical protein
MHVEEVDQGGKAEQQLHYNKGGAASKAHLEDLDELELATALDLKALELGEAAVKVEDGIALLDQLPLLLRRGEDHRLQEHAVYVA